MNRMESIGERLREERKRIALSLRAFAEHGGVTEKTQVLYEKGERVPDAHYLARISSGGADVLYIVTGERSSSAMTPEEQALLAGFRALDPKGRAGVLGLIGGMTQPTQTTTMTFKGAVGQQVHGSITYEGNVDLNVGAGQKKRKCLARCSCSGAMAK